MREGRGTAIIGSDTANRARSTAVTGVCTAPSTVYGDYWVWYGEPSAEYSDYGSLYGEPSTIYGDYSSLYGEPDLAQRILKLGRHRARYTAIIGFGTAN